MEILKDTVPKVTFFYPSTDTTVSSVTWTKNGVMQAQALQRIEQPGVSTTVSLPYQNEEAEIDITWNFTIPGSGTATKTDQLNVVTPYMTFRDAVSIDPTISNNDFLKTESAVRNIINSFTGQSFGKTTGPKTVRGAQGKALQLPSRLISLNSVNSNTDISRFFIINDGYFLRIHELGIPPLKGDFYGLHYETNGVITNPNDVYLRRRRWGFHEYIDYVVDGVWGWENVPAPVREAALLLFNDYFDPSSHYRDRYVASMIAADWKLQFADGAFMETGNVRANQLLADYIMPRGWAVV